MSINHNGLVGQWVGINKLMFEGAEHESKSTASVSFVAQRQFQSIAYTWEYQNKQQDGLILFQAQNVADSPACWLDSWHMSNAVMACKIAKGKFNSITLLGSYAAPPGPDWGWRIEIEQDEAPAFEIRMFNITPEGQEYPAVIAHYERNSDTKSP